MQLSPDFINLLASILVGIGSVLAVYLTLALSSKKTAKKEEDIEKAAEEAEAANIKAPPLDLPSNLPSADYEMLLGRIISDLSKNPTFSHSNNKPDEALMRNYHEQALAQAKVQFWFGIVAAIVGFIWVLFGGFFMNSISGLTRIIPGTIVSAVAGLFLKQSREIRQRATDFYDRLHSYGRQRDALMLVAAISDAHVRGAAQTLLALHMAGSTTADAVKVLIHEISGKTKNSNQNAGRALSKEQNNPSTRISNNRKSEQAIVRKKDRPQGKESTDSPAK